MRSRERIQIFMNHLSREFIHKLFILWFKTNFEDAEEKIIKKKRSIKKFWTANHDLRFSQVLVNMGFISNLPGEWYYQEDEDVLFLLGYQ